MTGRPRRRTADFAARAAPAVGPGVGVAVDACRRGTSRPVAAARREQRAPALAHGEVIVHRHDWRPAVRTAFNRAIGVPQKRICREEWPYHPVPDAQDKNGRSAIEDHGISGDWRAIAQDVVD